jgi:hypothetical protein
MWPRLGPLPVALAAMLALAPGRAVAQTAVEIAAARQWFKEGEAADRAGDWATAIVKFQKALDVKATPQLELRIGACQEKLGLFASARGSYERALAMARAASAGKVAEVAEEQLAAVEPRVPRLTIRLAERYEGVRVTVDGEVVEASPGAPLAVDPGTHQVVAEASGRRSVELALDLRAGEARAVTLELASLATGEAPPSEPAPVAPGPGALPYVLFGVGGAAVAGGAVLFVVALGQDSDIDERCGGVDRLACPASQRESIEADVAGVDRLEGLALGLGGLGVAAAVVGGALLASGGDERSGRAGPPRVALAPLPGGGGLIVSGGF